MDTKWKKLKIAVSCGTFFLGMTLLISSLIPVLNVLWITEGNLLTAGMDYQEDEEFRGYIEDRLEELLGVATGGKSWKNYGTGAVSERGYYFGWDGDYPDWGWNYSEDTSVLVEQTDEEYAFEGSIASGTDASTSDYWEDYGAYDNGQEEDEETLDAYMADMALNQNLLYAVIYQGNLLYTNIDAFADKTGEPWQGEDFYEAISKSEYNFSLWFNREGDGKVQIVKDNIKENVYGNGVYTRDSRWFVPGYANFRVDASTNDAVIFMAATKEPKLYVVGNYSLDGADWYSGRLYSMYENRLHSMEQFEKKWTALIVSVLLLALSVLLRKEKQLGKQAIARFMGKIWFEAKALLILGVSLFLCLLFVVGEIGEMYSFIYINYGSFSLGDAYYYMDMFAGSEKFLTLLFWVVYLIVLDVRANRGQQKKPILDSIRTRNLQYPIQKKLIKRYRLTLAAGILAAVLCGLLLMSAAAAINGGNYYLLNLGEFVEDYLWSPLSDGAQLILLILISILLILSVLNIAYMKTNRRMAEDIGALINQIEKVKKGNLAQPLILGADTDLGRAAESLNEIQCGMEEALQEQMHSERMKVELVTNVSHDIKTPLTSIISYVELLKQEEGLPEHVMEFIRILSEKSERLRNIVQDVFEVSKATSGQLPVKMEELDLGKLLRQTLADMDEQISASTHIMKVSISEEPMLIRADGQRLYRVFQNLIQNALKYSLQGSRIFLILTDKKEEAVVSIKNTSSVELDDGADLTERFVRGDESRTDGGSGLGLSIAKSFTQACGGSLSVKVDADLFTVTVVFPRIPESV
ncbi:HAMP domain-containing sensor histidine kinase [Parablautia muri]|uniref:histidine kinase n=1 Tax=Parablautia muri TaxID=2320879 RepID=A0A9X5GRB5_9FIRM|nr:HAMP domain-containing sensor histidine kinase [Parablautia muri]NBJ92006.1 sensor histidine kinase [Parablautia muri]